MFYFSLNISESHIFDAKKPMKFNEFLVKVIPVLGLYNNNFQELTKQIQKLGFKMTVLGEITKPVSLYTEKRYKSVKYMYGSKVLTYQDNTYEFLYGLKNQLLSITIHGDEYRTNYREQKVDNYNNVANMVLSLMMPLCSVEEKNPQQNTVSATTAIAEQILKSKTESKRNNLEIDAKPFNNTSTVFRPSSDVKVKENPVVKKPVTEIINDKVAEDSSKEEVLEEKVHVRETVSTVEVESVHLQDLFNEQELKAAQSETSE